ncbi:3-hydroxyacyl-CoA dehydrogenase family protein [Burkholderia sp. MSMB1835]|uniref:3-hydroxyacyl-CoA dehydrogenase family protein n=1 Tax=Burkholderia sp. MSMB1835 TaxID=1637876 RepID=UPI0027B88BE6|nr:3-hydroxyacyl-CoA dehydrogenase family protein [Burkholderia sp. MSMB1835]
MLRLVRTSDWIKSGWAPPQNLLEFIRGSQTSDETLARMQSFAEAIGKIPIVSRNCLGFTVNRIFRPMINGGILALQEGLATEEDTDNGMRLGANHPIGPLRTGSLSIRLNDFGKIQTTGGRLDAHAEAIARA